MTTVPFPQRPGSLQYVKKVTDKLILQAPAARDPALRELTIWWADNTCSQEEHKNKQGWACYKQINNESKSLNTTWLEFHI